MERKLKVAMDNLVKKIKAATSRRPVPGIVFIVSIILLSLMLLCDCYSLRARDVAGWSLSNHCLFGFPNGSSVCLSPSQSCHRRLGGARPSLGQGLGHNL